MWHRHSCACACPHFSARLWGKCSVVRDRTWPPALPAGNFFRSKLSNIVALIRAFRVHSRLNKACLRHLRSARSILRLGTPATSPAASPSPFDGTPSLAASSASAFGYAPNTSALPASVLLRGLCGSGLVAALPAVLALVFDASLQVPGEFLFSSKIRCGRVSQAVTVLQNLRGMKKGSRFRLPELSRAVVLELELQGQRHGARVAREDRFGIQEVRSRWIQVRTSGCARRIAE